MKLSLWHIADRLKEYRPQIFIEKGAAEITSARYASDELGPPSANHTYIGITDNDCHLVMHRNDYLVVECSDSETLMNEVLKAFDYYETWEKKLHESALSSTPFQVIANLSAEVTNNPVCIGDYEGNVLALSEQYGPDDVDDKWKELHLTGVIPTSYTAPPILNTKGEILDDWTPTPQFFMNENGAVYICANVMAENEQIAGFYTEQFNTPLTPGHLQLSEIICEAIAYAATNALQNRIVTPSSAMKDILTRTSTSSKPLVRYTQKHGWKKPWQLMVFENYPQSYSELKQRNLINNIKKFGLGAIACSYERKTIVVFESDEIERFLNFLDEVIELSYFSIGISLPFHDWLDLPYQYRQAAYCILRNDDVPGVFKCADYAFSYLTSTVKNENSEMKLCHPALSILKEYDKAHHSEFYLTLQQFLFHERNLVHTAEALHIHRNSLVYRIRRIKELTHIDLDDPESRLFASLSYYLNESI